MYKQNAQVQLKAILIESLIKKGKFQIWAILDKFELVCQSLSYEAEIFTMSSFPYIKAKKVKLDFWKIFSTFDFMLILHEKIVIFSYF